MFDRFAIYSSADQLAETFAIDVPESYQISYNAGPGQLHPIITSDDPRGLAFFYWGLMPKLAHDKSISMKLINTTSEVLSKPGYQKKLRVARCLIPVNGFFLWKVISKKQQTPYYFFPRQMELMGIAGLWEESEDLDGQVIHSFVAITVPVSHSLSDFSPWMPALLTPSLALDWLSSGMNENAALQLIQQTTNHHPALESHPVSPRISQLKINQPDLIQPRPASDQHGNYTLFT